MKCPKCGAAVDGKSSCDKCGAATRPASDTFDVTYKTFGTSELLEIGPRKKEAEPGKKTADKTMANPMPKVPLRQKPAPAGNKMFFGAAAAVLLIVLMAGMFFWFYSSRR